MIIKAWDDRGAEDPRPASPGLRFGVLALIAWYAAGPWALVLGLMLIAWRCRRLMPVLATAGVAALVSAVLIVLPMLLPQGTLPMLQQPGEAALMFGNAISNKTDETWTFTPIEAEQPWQNPHLVANPSNSMHNDAWASDSYPQTGPEPGDPGSMRVDSRAYGVLECATMTFVSNERMVAQCGNLRGSTMQIISTRTLKPLASLKLGKRAKSDKKPWEDLCGGSYFYLDNEERAIAATAAGSIVRISTHDADGDPALQITDTWDLTASYQADSGDCLIALMPDADGLVWWETQDGVVGTLNTDTGDVKTLDLGEQIANSMAADADGSVYVVSVERLYRLKAAKDGTPKPVWSTPYDRGSKHQPGTLSRGSGTTPTLLDNGLLAITDNADGRINVLFLDRDKGEVLCKAPVFEKGQSATENSLISLGDAVVVENNFGYRGPQSTMLGRTVPGGLARVDVGDGTDGAGGCKVAWTSEEIAPTSVPKVSWANGLLYAVGVPGSWTGVSGYYLTAIDSSTGKTVFRQLLGSGWPSNNHYSAVTIGPDGSAYVATMGGLYRVKNSSH